MWQRRFEPWDTMLDPKIAPDIPRDSTKTSDTYLFLDTVSNLGATLQPIRIEEASCLDERLRYYHHVLLHLEAGIRWDGIFSK